MQEPGLDLHEWETQWAQFDEDAADDPGGAVAEMARLVEEMLAARGYQLDEPVTAEGEEAELVRAAQSAREVARLIEQDVVEEEDIQSALEDLRAIHDTLVAERPAP